MAMAKVELIIYNADHVRISLKVICMCYGRTVLVLPQMKSHAAPP